MWVRCYISQKFFGRTGHRERKAFSQPKAGARRKSPLLDEKLRLGEFPKPRAFPEPGSRALPVLLSSQPCRVLPTA